ncbi:biotin--[acetyl-CoA-carboxylase] ligase [Geminocystis sp. NIES-3709]|uniref:biotin--[acetyl-CoA-carboxylase] ligase n=1 Tax=Geminocystis sp. NIES-3709 TaxID=1617448 RepID=UPI0005FC7709|nr:biotin--[acetyl-CoA-carboxylase] ligase [Geminocystis sp. NIES-3709]BAQ65833.1 biotin--protein ligase [Geminocystis sp. NIES-3709]
MEQITFNLPNNFSSLIVKQNTITGYVYDTLTSTNTQAWQLLSENISPPFVVIAKQQTAGKGQRGNIWRSSLGGLYLSMVLDLNLSIEYINHLTLWSISGIVSALNQWDIPVKIKWLNDLILQDKKLGGILCETKTEKKNIKTIVIGVGINYENSYPCNGISLNVFLTREKKSSIKSLHQLEEIVTFGILNGYEKYLKLGINDIVDNYNKSLYNLNEKVFLEKFKGEILGINNQGNLQIKLSSSGASSKINLSPQNYRISYHKSPEQFYIVTLSEIKV